MRFRTLSLAAAVCATSPAAASAATPAFQQGAGSFTLVHPAKAGCTVCTATYTGTLTTVLSNGTVVVFKSLGTTTYYIATATPSGTGGYCFRVNVSFKLTAASGTLDEAQSGLKCDPSKTGDAGTFIGTYVHLGGTGAFASWHGLGEVASVVNAKGDGTLSYEGTI
jgi:hypothetical protein